MNKFLLTCWLLIVNLGLFAQTSSYKDFAYFQYPDYKNEIFDHSFINNSLKEKVTSTNFKPYFFASSNDWDDVLNGLYDDDGVVLRKSDNIHFPTSIIRTALTSYYKYEETQNEAALEIIMNQVRWLKNNFYVNDSKYGFWVFTNYSKEYKLKPGWVSVMSQGMGIGACLMAYNLTGDEEYLNVVDLALKGFYVPVKNGGFKRELNSGVWFEEYPTPNPSFTLNGFIFGLAGLESFNRNSNNSVIKELFDKATETLSKNIDMFQGNFTSYYSKLYPYHFTKDSYHKIHVLQLAWLCNVANKQRFYDFSKKFLDIHVNKFKINSALEFQKIKSVDVNNCINCEDYGSSNLIDDKWSWGKYWSSYKSPSVTLDFGSKRKIESIYLYGVNVESTLFGLELYNLSKPEEDKLINTFKRLKSIEKLSYMITGNYKTFIRKLELPKGLVAEKVELKFKGTSRKEVLALREIQFEMDMHSEMEEILKWIDKKYAQ